MSNVIDFAARKLEKELLKATETLLGDRGEPDFFYCGDCDENFYDFDRFIEHCVESPDRKCRYET